MRSLRTRRLPAGAVAVLSGLLLAGCFGSPRPEFFALRAGWGPAGGPPVASLPDLGLAVGPVDFPRYLDRPEIVTRAAGDATDKLVVADVHRWGGSLSSDVLRVMADDLGRLLGTARIAVYPAQPRFPATYRVLIDVRELGGVLGGPVTARVRWSILAGPRGEAVAVEESKVEQAAASASYEDFVAAESTALATVTRAIAERIASLDTTASH
jgi:uncharacterized lipoprotein YmbA